MPLKRILCNIWLLAVSDSFSSEAKLVLQSRLALLFTFSPLLFGAKTWCRCKIPLPGLTSLHKVVWNRSSWDYYSLYNGMVYSKEQVLFSSMQFFSQSEGSLEWKFSVSYWWCVALRSVRGCCIVINMSFDIRKMRHLSWFWMEVSTESNFTFLIVWRTVWMFIGSESVKAVTL